MEKRGPKITFIGRRLVPASKMCFLACMCINSVLQQDDVCSYVSVDPAYSDWMIRRVCCSDLSTGSYLGFYMTAPKACFPQ